MYAAPLRHGRKEPAPTLHSAIWGMSLLASALFTAVAVSPAAIAADRSAGNDKYLVFFTPDSAEISPAAQTILDKAVVDAGAVGAGRIIVRGYAGDEETKGMRLAAQRAETVAKAISMNGAAGREVRSVPAGISDSPASELTPEMDRRVEIVVERGSPSFSVSRYSPGTSFH